MKCLTHQMSNLSNICHFTKNEANQKSMLFLPTNDIKVGLCHGLPILVVSPAGVSPCVPHLHILDKQGIDLIVEVQEFVALPGFYHLTILHPVYRQHVLKVLHEKYILVAKETLILL